MSNFGNENLKGKNRIQMSAKIRQDSNQIGDQSPQQHEQPMNSTLPLLNSHFTNDKGVDYENDPIPKRSTTREILGFGVAAGQSNVITMNKSITDSKGNIGSSYQSRYEHINQNKQFVKLVKSNKWNSQTDLISQNNGPPKRD